MIRNFSANVVRTKYDYETYVPAKYRAQYSYDDSKAYFPWLVITPYKDEEDGILPDSCKLTFEPTPDFTNLDETLGVVTKSADGKYLNINWASFGSLLIDVNKEVYPNGEFADGECKIVMFEGDLDNPTKKIEVEVGELSVSEAQALIALNFNQQGQAQVGKLLNTLATKVYGVTYNTPPIS